MAKTKSSVAKVEAGKIEPALKQVSGKLAGCKALRQSTILVHATGTGGGDFCLRATDKGVELVSGAAMETPPSIEIIGDVRRIQSVLAGTKDARALFLAGAFRLRGDLRYFSDLALELGIIKEPL